MGNKKAEGKGGWIREKEGKAGKGKWVKDLGSEGWNAVEHFIFKDPNIYAFFNILRVNISYSLLFSFSLLFFSGIVLYIRSILFFF